MRAPTRGPRAPPLPAQRIHGWPGPVSAAPKALTATQGPGPSGRRSLRSRETVPPHSELPAPQGGWCPRGAGEHLLLVKRKPPGRPVGAPLRRGRSPPAVAMHHAGVDPTAMDPARAGACVCWRPSAAQRRRARQAGRLTRLASRGIIPGGATAMAVRSVVPPAGACVRWQWVWCRGSQRPMDGWPHQSWNPP